MEYLKLNGNTSLQNPNLLKIFCDNLKGNNTLLELSLSGVEIGDEGAEIICDHLLHEIPL